MNSQDVLHGPNGMMCVECCKWDDCLKTFTPLWRDMKVIQTYKNEPFLNGGTFKVVKCDLYKKEVS